MTTAEFLQGVTLQKFNGTNQGDVGKLLAEETSCHNLIFTLALRAQ